MWETWVWSLGQEYPVQKEMATHSSTLARKTLWTEEADRLYSPWGRKESDMTERLHFTLYIKLSVHVYIYVYKDPVGELY